jgi:hypothetical protein
MRELILYNSENTKFRVLVLSHGLGMDEIDGVLVSISSRMVASADVEAKKKTVNAAPYKNMERFLVFLNQIANLRTNAPIITTEIAKL